MTIYYVSPFALTNGTGTWAAPYSTNSPTRAALVAGDEVRLVSKLLTDILFPTVYTATLTDYRTLTLTAGGGLGADFVTGNICYLPQWDTFFRVTAVVGNTITVGTSSCLPIYNSAVNTNVTVQRVTSGVPAGASTAQTVWTAMADNVTVTDGWIADGVRVTDGTAKSLITSGTSGVTVRIDNSSGTITPRTGVTIDLGQTHVMPGVATTGSAQVVLATGGADFVLGQVYTHTTGTTALSIGTTSSIYIGGSITIKHMSGYGPLGGICVKNATLIFERTAMRYGDFVLYSANSTVFTYVSHCTITFGGIVSGNSGAANSLFYGNALSANDVTFTEFIDCYGTQSTSAVSSLWGDYQLTLAPSLSIYNSRRVNNPTAFTHRFQLNGIPIDGPAILAVPTISLGTKTISTADLQLGNIALFNTNPGIESALYKQPTVMRIESPYVLTAVSRYPQASSLSRNILVTYRDGTLPVEVLGIDSSPYSSNIPASNAPRVVQDSGIVHTVGPSLKASISTRTAAYWPSHARAVKPIKIPVTGGLSYTISGYVRSNVSGFTTGDCRMSVVFANAEVAGQDMTSAAYAAWEQFTLTFTAAYTGEAILAWELYYRAAGDIWLDDLTIS